MFAQKGIDQKVTQLLSEMTLKEKIGQMNQYNGFMNFTGPMPKDGSLSLVNLIYSLAKILPPKRKNLFSSIRVHSKIEYLFRLNNIIKKLMNA